MNTIPVLELFRARLSFWDGRRSSLGEDEEGAWEVGGLAELVVIGVGEMERVKLVEEGAGEGAVEVCGLARRRGTKGGSTWGEDLEGDDSVEVEGRRRGSTDGNLMHPWREWQHALTREGG